MGKTLPFDITIDTIALEGFSTTVSPLKPTKPITHYHGGPLYCHVTPDPGASTVSILIDEIPPNSYAPAKALIKNVGYTYRSSGSAAAQTQSWDISSLAVSYTPALLVEHKLVFTAPAGAPAADLSVATLKISQLNAPSTRNSLGLIVLGHRFTSGQPEGYFVTVPMSQGSDDPTDYAAMGISWTADLGVAGPIGGGTIP